jgi:hypothetical protein
VTRSSTPLEQAVALLRDRDRLRIEGKPMPSNETFCKMLLDSLAQSESAAPVTPSHAAQRTAKQRFDELMVEDTTPLERLRFFCSLAMNGQDWLDVEPFFDALRLDPVAVQEAWAKLDENTRALQSASERFCTWYLDGDDGDCYVTSCGEHYVYSDGTLKECEARYCQGCGGKIDLLATESRTKETP